MGLSLLLAVFETDILLKSNVKGGKSKINKRAETHTALNETGLTAIHCKFI